MRNAWCCAMLALAARTIVAQDKPVSFEESRPLAISGFAVGLASWDRNLKQNTFAGSKLAVGLFHPLSDHLYFFGQLTTSLGREETTGESHTEIEIDNLIVSWTPPGATGLNLSFGRFDAPVGFERDDEPLNVIPTNSFNFELARPAKLTGAIARYAINPTVSVAGYVANGWNAELDNNTGKTAGLRVQLFPAAGVAIGGNLIYGPEETGTNSHQRTLLAADATLQPVSRFIVGLEVNRGLQRESGSNATWIGAAGTVFWRAARQVGLSVRGEVLQDADGIPTGQPQTLKSLTISPWFFYREAQEGVFANIENTTFHLPAFSIRPGLRIDSSTQPYFADADGLLRKTNVSAVIELVYLF
jgi:hypothetical protein